MVKLLSKIATSLSIRNKYEKKNATEDDGSITTSFFYKSNLLSYFFFVSIYPDYLVP